MTSESDTDTFLYFAYGSNLSKARIHINNPSAEFVSIAKLKDYKFYFGHQDDWMSATWHGCTATVEPAPGCEAWGALWKLRMPDMESLDRQETHYQPITVSVVTPGDPGLEYKCRTYQMLECIPDLTSPQYKNVVVTGAKEVGLPEDYMKFLNDFKHNGYDGHVEICDKL